MKTPKGYRVEDALARLSDRQREELSHLRKENRRLRAIAESRDVCRRSL